MRIAILDDYFNAATDLADWSKLDGHAEITTFTEFLGGDDAVVAALAEFEQDAEMVPLHTHAHQADHVDVVDFGE